MQQEDSTPKNAKRGYIPADEKYFSPKVYSMCDHLGTY